jgi:hypothetical protein
MNIIVFRVNPQSSGHTKQLHKVSREMVDVLIIQREKYARVKLISVHCLIITLLTFVIYLLNR